jgi:hypothetical protein
MRIVGFLSELRLLRGHRRIPTFFWVDPWRRSAIVVLQDRAQHIGESIDGCQKSLTTMYSVMLPRNPPPENFSQLLEVFKTS